MNYHKIEDNPEVITMNIRYNEMTDKSEEKEGRNLLFKQTYPIIRATAAFLAICATFLITAYLLATLTGQLGDVTNKENVIVIPADATPVRPQDELSSGQILVGKHTFLRSAVDVALYEFTCVATGAAVVYMGACSGTLAADVGLIIPGGALNSPTSCYVAGAAVSIINWSAWTLKTQNDQWQ